MSDSVLRGVLISDFNIANLAGLLANDPEKPTVEAAVAPFGQSIPALIDGDHEIWRGDPSFAVVWTRPEGVIESFHRFVRNEPESIEAVLREVEEYAAMLVRVAERLRTVFVIVAIELDDQAGAKQPLQEHAVQGRGVGVIGDHRVDCCR